MNSKINCTCGWSWNKSDSSKKDMYICHECGRDNSSNIPKAQSGMEIDWDKVRSVNDNPLVQTAKIFDPTGFTSWPDVGYAIDDYKKGKGSGLNVALNVLGALPVLGKLTKGAGMLAKSEKLVKAANTLSKVNKTVDRVEKIVPNVAKAIGKTSDIIARGSRAGRANPVAVAAKVVGKTVEKIEKLDKATRKVTGKLLDKIPGIQGDIGNIVDATSSLLNIGNTVSDVNSVVDASNKSSKPIIDKNKTIQYYNTDPNRGRVEKPGQLANVQYVPIQNSAQLKKWKQQGKLENGGWLDNYNDSQASAPEGYVGEGYSNVGRNFSPAWGGQFAEGGEIPQAQKGKKLKTITTNDPADPRLHKYLDSLNLYKGYELSKKYNKQGEYNFPDAPKGKVKYSKSNNIPHKSYEEYLKFSNEYDKRFKKAYDKGGMKAVNADPSLSGKQSKQTSFTKKEDLYKYDPDAKALIDQYEKLSFKEPVETGYWKTPDLYHPTIKETGSYYKGAFNPIFKKPNQEVVYSGNPEDVAKLRQKPYVAGVNNPKTQEQVILQRKPIQAIENNLQQIGIQNDFNIEADVPQIRQQVIQPKYYDVEDYTHGSTNYNGTQSNYRTDDLSTLSEQTPNNTRKIVPHYQMGGSIPGAVGFTYARTGSIPSNGKYAKKTMASAQDGKDMHGTPMYAQENYVEGLERSNYDPRLNRMNLGKDYNTWADKDRLKAHENYHAIQHAQGRDNFDIAHNTENRQWAEMQKRPEMMSTDDTWNNFYNRKNIETNIDVNREVQNFPEAQFFPQAAGDIIANKIVDPAQYNNPSSLEGEAQYYENTGKQFQNGGEMRYYQNGLDFQPKSISKNGSWLSKYNEGGIIKDDRGQWDHPGEITRIKGGNITMKKDPKTGKALTEPLLGIADTGEQQWMYPEEDYNFEGANYVTEIPKSKLAKNGIRQEHKGLQNLDNLVNFTNYNKPQPGGWLNKYN